MRVEITFADLIVSLTDLAPISVVQNSTHYDIKYFSHPFFFADYIFPGIAWQDNRYIEVFTQLYLRFCEKWRENKNFFPRNFFSKPGKFWPVSYLNTQLLITTVAPLAYGFPSHVWVSSQILDGNWLATLLSSSSSSLVLLFSLLLKIEVVAVLLL